MTTFLENICDEIVSKYRNIIPDICVVFPSRRAGLYFKNVLGKKSGIPVWSPSVYSIEDFVEEFSSYSFADNFKLLSELYTSYSDVMSKEEKINKNSSEYADGDDGIESFDSFYSWGEMLLNDFDIIDKYLADTNLLFKRITDLKEMEESFPLELQESFKNFWGTLVNGKQTGVKKNFLKIWNVLGKVYTDFTARLSAGRICYPGMAYRKLFKEYEDVISKFEWKKIIFAGFNSLNPVEEKIMKVLLDRGIAEIYWDADEYYISDNNQEAGNFIGKNLKSLNQCEIRFGKNLESDSKNIFVIGTSASVGMAKALGSELKELIAKNDFEEEKSAIVLPDCKLLLPVLYSIPDEIKKINVTMGFRFSDTPLFSLIYLLMELQENSIYENGQVKFHYVFVKKILLHQYIKFQDPSVVYGILNLIKKENKIYFSLEDYARDVPRILKIIFSKVESMGNVISYISDIIDIISSKIGEDESKDNDYKKIQAEYLYNFFLYFNRLNDVIRESGIEMNIDTYKKLLIDILKKISIPFTGEPLKGLQVMGLLETRALDFENVFMLSVNEGILPEGKTQNSFIPYSLRKALKIPTFETEDSITAYYFYRLMQRAKNIYLIYDVNFGNYVREKSRFILQIENELIRKNKNINYVSKTVIAELCKFEKKNIAIQKNNKVSEKLKNIGHFSPTAVSEFIFCPLQFYFKRVAGIKEEEKIEESFTPLLIGNVIHKILEEMYKPYKGKIINEKILKEIEKTVTDDFDNIFRDAVGKCESDYILKEYNGRNILFRDIVAGLLKRLLECEKSQIPFKILDLEKEVIYKLKIPLKNEEISFRIKGRIDRIDEKDGIIRIIDYKTGNYELKKFDERNPDEYFNRLISDAEYKDNFQAFFYGYFYWKNNEGKKINVGIYPIKKILNGLDKLKKDYIEIEEFLMFEYNLRKLFSGIYDSDVAFIQTEDEKKCAFCPYSGLCYRDLKNTI